MFYVYGRFHSTLYAHLLQQQWEIKMAFFGKKTFQIQGEFVDLKVQKEHYRIPFASWFKSLFLPLLWGRLQVIFTILKYG